MSEEQLRGQLVREIEAINSVFRAHGVLVRSRPKLTHVAGDSYIFYGLECDPSFNVGRIGQYVLNLQEALSRARGRACPVSIRLMPLGILVDHPHPKPLTWRGLRGLFTLNPGQALLGRSYINPDNPWEILDLNVSPHVLIAGMTGSGKSTLELMLAMTLMISTPVRDLEIYAIDLKNEDLAPLRSMPHVRRLASSPADAAEVIDYVHRIKDERVATGRGPYRRIVLLVDELAEMQACPQAISQLERLANIGRSKAINLVVATQKPLTAIVGRMTKANFTTRLVGRTADADEAEIAAGRSKTGAHLLPGRGAFLRVEGIEPVRFQAYLLDDIGLRWLANQARKPTSADDLRPMPVRQEHNAAGQEAPVAPVAQGAPAIPPALAAVFEQDALPDGTLRYGGMRRAAVALRGPDAPTAGRAYEPVKREIEEWFARWKSSRMAKIHKLPLGKGPAEGFREGLAEGLADGSGQHNRAQTAD